MTTTPLGPGTDPITPGAVSALRARAAARPGRTARRADRTQPDEDNQNGSGDVMKAIVLNCTLKASPELSNTQELADTVIEAMEKEDVQTTTFRLADLITLDRGVETTMSDVDQWPRIHDAIVDCQILVIATPTWLGHPSSYAQQALERLNGMTSETDDNDAPVAFGKVAGVVVTGNEDGAHHVISEIAQGLIDIGFTIPGQAWTYWNRGPGPGPSYSETDEKHDWSEQTGRTMTQQLVRVAHALGAETMGS